MKQFHLIAALSAVTMSAIFLAGCKKTDNTPSQSTPPKIDVAEAVVDSVMIHNEYPGYLSANRKLEIVAKVSGTLISQNYTDGDIVKSGQVLFTIDPTLYADQVRQAEATLASAQSASEYARSHYAAVKQALEKDAVSQQEVLQAENSMKQAEASVKNARAALETARTRLSYCTVRAPQDGRMTSSTVSVGSYVDGDGTPFTLATLYDDSSMTAEFTIEDDAHLKMIAAQAKTPGVDYNHVKLEFDESLPHTYTAVLNYTAPEVDKGTGTILLKAKTQNQWGELRDGMFVKVILPFIFERQAIMVKDASLGTDQLGRYLYTVNDSNKVVYTPVKTGELVNDSMRVITEGLTPGSRYVTKALLKVRNGESITPNIVK